MDNLENFDCYDSLLYAPFNQLGWLVTPVSWRKPDTNWDDFEAVIIRSPWDYQDDASAFLELLETIDHSAARLLNALELVKWNISKTYLLDLEKKSIPIVPSIFANQFNSTIGQSFFKKFKSKEIVIKPVISANADDTFRLTENDLRLEELEKTFAKRDYLAQPFIREIVDEGEFSLFFFAGRYSHAILKTPKENDFRVQEEHGGQLRLIDPEPRLLEIATRTMATLSPTPLYGRADFVRWGEQFYLMELELIEPSLYFNMDPASPERFANTFQQWMNSEPNSKGL